MQIIIGSTNPVKVRAARNILRRIHPRARFISIEAASGVRVQPIGEEETLRGAINRAQGALATAKAAWGVGLEAGIIETPYGMMTTAWCAIVDRNGHVGLGGATNMLLPKAVAERVRAGAELGEAMDAFSGIKNVKHKMGALGILTKGLTDRQKAYEFLLKLALARMLWDEY